MAQQWITVFGGTGFLGRCIVRALVDGGLPVRIAARRPEAVTGVDPTSEMIECCHADLHDTDSVKRALDGARGAVNAVSLYVEQGNKASFDSVHVDGAERLARMARDGGVERLVHISGIGVDTESDSAYVRARARGENRVRAVFPEATVLRPSVLFGPDDAFLTALSRVTQAPVLPLFGTGATRLQPVYVEDVARAVHQALIRPDTAGRVYELGGARVYSYRELVDLMLHYRQRRRLLLPFPFPLWRGLARLTSMLPRAPLTRDQVILMERDNRVEEGASGFADLGLEPNSLEALLDTCLTPQN